MLALTERGRREATRAEIVELLGGSAKAADHVIESLRRKGWLQRATWGEYLLIPPEQGPDALGDSNLLALASRVADPYYIGFSTAAAHYGLTTQHRNVILVVTPVRLRAREVGEARVRIVNPSANKFFGFEPVDVLGYKVMISDREKTAIDCIDRPALAGGVGEAAIILATASRRFDWTKAANYLRTDRFRRPRAALRLARRSRRGRYAARDTRPPDSGWPEAAARERGSARSLSRTCRTRSDMTRPGVCSSTYRARSCTAAPGSAGAKRSGRTVRNAYAAAGSALLQ